MMWGTRTRELTYRRKGREGLMKSPKVEVRAFDEKIGHSLNLECCQCWKSSKSPIWLLSEVFWWQ